MSRCDSSSKSSRELEGAWARRTPMATGAGADNCCPEGEWSAGLYRLVFDTASYFSARNIEGVSGRRGHIYVRDGESQFHIPLLLSANGYTTYRGS